MQLTIHRRELRLKETFTIARGSTDADEVVSVELQHDGITAYGEGAAVEYHGETAASMESFLHEHAAAAVGDDPFALEAISRRLADIPGNSGAKMALDGALHDWIGKRAQQPLWRLYGIDPAAMPPTSFTIGIGSVEAAASRARQSRQYHVLKVKVGGPDDLARLEAIRAVSAARFRVDGNEGWTIDQAIALLPVLIDLGVEFIEQPFPSSDRRSYEALRNAHPRLPVIIDEACTDLASVAEVARYADGINIKLAKSGGIREALRMIHAARALGLRIMIGCMIESQLGIAQAAQIAPLVDDVDLDGHLLIESSPFVGLGFSDGAVRLSGEPGLGVRPA